MRRRTLMVCAVAGLCGIGVSTGLASPPATYTVTNTRDSGTGSLRAALTYANAHTQTTIKFARTAHGTITLASTLPTVTRNVTIDGPGASTLTISGANAHRVLVISNSTRVSITDLQIIDGFASGDGGAIDNFGALALARVVISGSNAGDFGGAIANETGGTVAIAGSRLANSNALAADGGAIANVSADSGVAITLSGSVVSGNTASDGFGGGIDNDGPGAIHVVDSRVLNNAAYYSGGIDNTSTGTIVVTGSTVSANSGLYTGGITNYRTGAVTISGSTVSGNDGYYSGGLENESTGMMTVSGSTLLGNSGEVYGGGLAIWGSGGITITTSVFTNNRSYDGGAIYSEGPLTLTRSTLDGNVGTFGGGLYVDQGTVNILNLTVSGNRSLDGGGIYQALGATDVTNSTIAGNIASAEGSGLYRSAGTLSVKSTILDDAIGSPECDGTITDVGYNLSIDNSCGFTQATSHASTSPKLGALASNGGPTPTLLLLVGSPALDAIPVAECTLSTDQRGVARPQGGRCDIGAVEDALVTVSSVTTHPLTGGTLKLTVFVPVSARATVSLLNGTTVKKSLPQTAAFTGNKSLHLSLKGVPAGMYTLKVSVSAVDGGSARISTTTIHVKK